MAGKITDLYSKYTNKVGKTLENDRYFQYLFEMVSAGTNNLQQHSQILHKKVDERWLTTIEEAIDSINEIIEKPRRFVTTQEEIVPVALAKKITADSVRHLSQHSEFIASAEDDDIQPTRVLNVTTEETYDLYENRFIYHLIQKLVAFIDKRTDVIFWSTGDETKNVLVMNSKVDDAYEQIEYKIEMSIKNRQSFAENDTNNMDLFMRIDRIRRLVMSLKTSAFCSLMAGCARVRSPIQRTNLMMKDPNYRTCYKLWQFLESYDDVGYEIEVLSGDLYFDEEYMIQMYTNFITNYTVFKTILETDPRDINNPNLKKRRTIKPKFVKQITEETVFNDDFDLDDVEVRQVFLEEVTEAQLQAEAELKEQKEKMVAFEKQRDQDVQLLQDAIYNLEGQIGVIENKAKLDLQTLRDEKRDVEDQYNSTLAERNELEALYNAELEKHVQTTKQLAQAIEDRNKIEAAANQLLESKKESDALKEEALAAKAEAERVANEAVLAKEEAEKQKAMAISDKEEALKQAEADRLLKQAAETLAATEANAREKAETAMYAMEADKMEALNALDEMKQAFAALEAKFNAEVMTRTSLEESLAKEQAKRTAAEKMIDSQNTELTNVQATLNDAMSSLKKESEEKESVLAKLAEETADRLGLKDSLELLQSKFEAVTASLSNTEDQLQKETADKKNVLEKLATVTENLNKTADELVEQKSQTLSANEKVKSLQQQLDNTTSEKDNFSVLYEEQTKLRQAVETTLAERNRQLDTVNNMLSVANENLEHETRLRKRAEKRAEGTVLSRYIIRQLRGDDSEQ